MARLGTVVIFARLGSSRAAALSEAVVAASGSPIRVESVDDALTIVQRSEPDAIAISLHKSFVDRALEAIPLLRVRTDAPLIALCAPHSGAVVARALAAGADTFLTDIPPAEILCDYVRDLRRRVGSTAALDASVIRVRDLVLDLDRCTVAIGGADVPVTVTEFRLLSVLARRAGCVISAQELVREALGYIETDLTARDMVKVHIHRLRAKLGSLEGDQPYIVAARGFGYMLDQRTHPRAEHGEAAPPDTADGAPEPPQS